MKTGEMLLAVKKNRKYLWVLPIAIGAVIALFAPLDVLSFAPAQWFVKAMAVVVPMINNINASYELSQVAQLYFAVMWMLAPVIYYLLYVGEKKDQLVEITTHQAPFWLRFMFFVMLFMFCCYLIFFSKLDPFSFSGTGYFIVHNRLAMATYGGVVVIGFVALTKLLIVWALCFREIYFQRSEK